MLVGFGPNFQKKQTKFYLFSVHFQATANVGVHRIFINGFSAIHIRFGVCFLFMASFVFPWLPGRFFEAKFTRNKDITWNGLTCSLEPGSWSWAGMRTTSWTSSHGRSAFFPNITLPLTVEGGRATNVSHEHFCWKQYVFRKLIADRICSYLWNYIIYSVNLRIGNYHTSILQITSALQRAFKPFVLHTARIKATTRVKFCFFDPQMVALNISLLWHFSSWNLRERS